MTDEERERRFRAERREQIKRAAQIQAETFALIKAQLEEARTRISVALASSPREFQTWRLTQLQAEVRRALGEVEARAGVAVAQGLDRSWQAGAELVTKPLAAAGIDIEPRLVALDPRLLDQLKTFQTDRIRDISSAAVSKINTEIAQAAIGTQTPFEAASKVAAHLGGAEDRARTIVRLELGTAYSAAGHQRMAQAIKAGVKGLRKQWRRSGKLHPRLTHELADGQVTEVDQPFMVGGKPIMFPRDPAAPIGERINCGCGLLPFMAHWRLDQPGQKPYTDAERAASRAVRQSDQIRADTERQQAATPPDALAATTQAARAYVVDQGRRTGHEHLVAVDERTGEVVERRTDGRRSSVSFGDGLMALMRDPQRSLAFHHNHPSSSALSQPDVLVLDSFPGAAAIAAYGHDGGFTEIRRGPRWGERKFKSFVLLVDEVTRRELQRRVNDRDLAPGDATALHAWLRLVILEKSGLASTRAEPGSAWAGLIADATWVDDFATRVAKQLMERAP
ncbi:hypothetical protein [Zavarzinia aquatilis]|uniref:Phage head morphogenesis domain-containing protein n=1 Tax=Zavarzinia aquatilis TaxID=2211142 RepID=A0A317DXK1_9PROT|nr:hypothetical protein [Zavarzinia aquatilis]PWR17683.1 hypothetical protein DKG74_20560 [Zavarzinia aquatilis]